MYIIMCVWNCQWNPFVIPLGLMPLCSKTLLSLDESLSQATISIYIFLLFFQFLTILKKLYVPVNKDNNLWLVITCYHNTYRIKKNSPEFNNGNIWHLFQFKGHLNTSHLFLIFQFLLQCKISEHFLKLYKYMYCN